MKDLEKCFKNRIFDYDKLVEYNFEKQKDKYVYKINICNNQFEMIVEISSSSKTSKLIDLANDDEYILVDIEESSGEFVGKVKEAYDEEVLVTAAYDETVIDKAAYDEKVLDHYECSCGATK